MTDEYNFTAQEIDRQDKVDSVIEEMLENLSPIGYVEWDMEIIGEIRDVVQDYIVNKKGWMSEQAFYPYRELDNDGNIILEPSKSEQEEMIIKSWDLEKVINKTVSEIDADDFAKLAGELLGGTCRYTDNFLYSFIPNEHYSGALDFTKELKRN